MTSATLSASSTSTTSTFISPSDPRSRSSSARARRRANLPQGSSVEARFLNAQAMRRARSVVNNNRQNEAQDLAHLSRSIDITPSPAMLKLYEVDPYVAALAFADGAGFNSNHDQLAEDPSTAAEPNIVPLSPANQIRNVLDFQREFRFDQPIVACASCGMTSLDHNDEEPITLMSAEGSVFRVQESHPLFQKYTTILEGPFPTDIQFFTVHVRREPGTAVSFYHLHSDLLVDAAHSTMVDDKLIYLCKECSQSCRRKKPALPFFNPANGYDFGKVPVGNGRAKHYPFNLTLAEQIVCAKCILQQTHIKFNATEEIGVQGHVVCYSIVRRLRSNSIHLTF